MKSYTTHWIEKTDIVLGTLAPDRTSGDDSAFLVWLDKFEVLHFAGRQIPLAVMDHDDRATLRRISMLRDCATAAEYYAAVEAELGPLIAKWWRITTN